MWIYCNIGNICIINGIGFTLRQKWPISPLRAKIKSQHINKKGDFRVRLPGNSKNRGFSINHPLPIIHNMFDKYLHWSLVLSGAAILGVVFSLMPDNAEATRSPAVGTEAILQDEIRLPLEIPSLNGTPQQSVATTKPKVHSNWFHAEIRSGDSLSALFDRSGLSAQELLKVTADQTAAEPLKRLYPGEQLKLRIDNATLTELVYDYDITHTLRMVRVGDGFESRIIEKPLESRTAQRAGIINDSLFQSAQSVGLSDRLTMELAGIFGWDIDFALDIRDGDSFAVIYEEIFLNGEKVRDGNIIAASFTNRGETFEAVRYTDSQDHADYYTPDGHSLRKAFLRTPVDFSRISSGFSMGRLHPILNKIRAHKGVDYASPIGTPIKSTGDGKIAFRGVKGGYGNVIIVQHGATYSTLYGHMSAFARGLQEGSRVRQGQVIGYVGKSGLASGPHLHYEFLVDNVHRNPLTVALPNAQPLPKSYMSDFKAKASPLLSSLGLLNRSKLALAGR